MHLRVTNGTNNKQNAYLASWGGFVGDLLWGLQRGSSVKKRFGKYISLPPWLLWVFVECKFVPSTPWSAEIRAVERDYTESTQTEINYNFRSLIGL